MNGKGRGVLCSTTKYQLRFCHGNNTLWTYWRWETWQSLHWGLVDDIPQAELVAVCRRDRLEGETLAAKYNCTYYADYRQLLADDRIDAVAVAVPPYLHREVVTAACHAGKHILLEKPFAVSVAEGRQLQELLSHSPNRCMVAHPLRFDAIIQALKQHIPQIAPLHSLYLSQRFEPSPARVA